MKQCAIRFGSPFHRQTGTIERACETTVQTV